ncbi:MAG TPA: CapA family protein, partial [Longilinea sp.]|nr:CapA family protein [Longilinea sp.]
YNYVDMPLKKQLSLALLLFLCGCQVLSPSPTATPSVTPEPTNTTTPTPIPLSELNITYGIDVPEGLRAAVQALVPEINTSASTAFSVELHAENPSDADCVWFYALVAPFPTILDDVSLNEVRQTWSGGGNDAFAGAPLLMSESTAGALTAVWGPPSLSGIEVIPPDQLLTRAWETSAWAIIPFEELDPQWKVLSIDGLSLLEENLDPATYPLRVGFSFFGRAEVIQALQDATGSGQPVLPPSNWDASLFTSVLMTGTTALVRSTAERMETMGLTYPGEDIAALLSSADFTHISNEVSFTPDCPEPNPWYINLQFCSQPEYIQLLEMVGVDIVELTGNHLADYGSAAILFTLDLYQQHNWLTFGGGADLASSQTPLLIENNGSRIAFLGCNPVGPEHVWATETSPGAAPCDWESLYTQIAQLRQDGYNVIVTLQDEESYTDMPYTWIGEHYDQLAEAGATIVSGSQAHYPMGFNFEFGSFVHYGLGNLFFDQMDYPVVGTRREFYDWHVFYNNRYISTVLFTGMLEDYARPRLMTDEERAEFLTQYFSASGWTVTQ